MPNTSLPHTSWIIDTGEVVVTSEGKRVKILELQHQDDATTLSSWAKHFRNHYCLDSEIDQLRDGTPHTRAQYLEAIKFPDASVAPGPSVRSGDFGEILVSDYLEFSLEYWVPRTRYRTRTVRNESTQGVDILGFKFMTSEDESPEDILALFESKAQFTGSSPNARLQDAVEGSAKDHIRRGESLNAIKQRLRDDNRIDDAKKVERFQDLVDHPYKEVFGAVALFSTPLYDQALIESTSVVNHPNGGELVLLVIKGENMMELVHSLYRRAADEA